MDDESHRHARLHPFTLQHLLHVVENVVIEAQFLADSLVHRIVLQGEERGEPILLGGITANRVVAKLRQFSRFLNSFVEGAEFIDQTELEGIAAGPDAALTDAVHIAYREMTAISHTFRESAVNLLH